MHTFSAMSLKVNGLKKYCDGFWVKCKVMSFAGFTKLLPKLFWMIIFSKYHYIIKGLMKRSANGIFWQKEACFFTIMYTFFWKFLYFWSLKCILSSFEALKRNSFRGSAPNPAGGLTAPPRPPAELWPGPLQTVFLDPPLYGMGHIFRNLVLKTFVWIRDISFVSHLQQIALLNWWI